MLLAWDENAWQDNRWWQAQDRKTLNRVNALLADVVRNSNDGIGKPEPLKHDFAAHGHGASLELNSGFGALSGDWVRPVARGGASAGQVGP